jgi:tetratricopeptide (TPR) repeat protein
MGDDRTELGSDLARDLIEASMRRGSDADRKEELALAAEALAESGPGSGDEIAHLWERLGNAYFETGDFERASDALERVVSSGLASLPTYERLAHCARELGRLADEVRYREAAVDRVPEDSARWRDLGVARRRAGSAREALISLREAARLDPEDRAGVGIEVGRTLRELGDAEGAVFAFREALRRRAESSELWGELANVYSEMGLFAESDQAVREAIRLKPANAAAWHTIATNALKGGHRDTAARAYRRMAELNPDFAEEIRTWVSHTAGLPPDALSESRTAAPPPPPAQRGRLLPFRRLRA